MRTLIKSKKLCGQAIIASDILGRLGNEAFRQVRR